ncbi:hypothetical protein JTB14_009636 [Gonioctena quinquepunctata]|nr:hypothetical protein JTB14_009636 [Gonioctena quinquepunctata]
MVSKHLGGDENSSTIKREVKLEVESGDDFNASSREDRIKKEPVENEPSSEYVFDDDSYPKQFEDEEWCEPDLVKLEDLPTEDFHASTTCAIEDPDIVTDDKVAVKEENLDHYSDDKLNVGRLKLKMKFLSNMKILKRQQMENLLKSSLTRMVQISKNYHSIVE